MTHAVILDSGLALRAPQNDGGEEERVMEELNRDEKKLAREALDNAFGPISKPPEDTRAAEIVKTHNRGQAALRQAEKAAYKGNLALSKKWTDVAQQMVAVQRRLEELTPQSLDPEQEEKLRAELRNRVAKFVEQDGGMQRWQMRREIWEEMAAEAKRTGAPMPSPMPPRPAHWSDDLSDELRLKLDAS